MEVVFLFFYTSSHKFIDFEALPYFLWRYCSYEGESPKESKKLLALLPYLAHNFWEDE
jgi:hypothetical protein